jgi:hypothetical protein
MNKEPKKEEETETLGPFQKKVATEKNARL